MLPEGGASGPRGAQVFPHQVCPPHPRLHTPLGIGFIKIKLAPPEPGQKPPSMRHRGRWDGARINNGEGAQRARRKRARTPRSSPGSLAVRSAGSSRATSAPGRASRSSVSCRSSLSCRAARSSLGGGGLSGPGPARACCSRRSLLEDKSWKATKSTTARSHSSVPAVGVGVGGVGQAERGRLGPGQDGLEEESLPVWLRPPSRARGSGHPRKSRPARGRGWRANAGREVRC